MNTSSTRYLEELALARTRSFHGAVQTLFGVTEVQWIVKVNIGRGGGSGSIAIDPQRPQLQPTSSTLLILPSIFHRY